MVVSAQELRQVRTSPFVRARTRSLALLSVSATPLLGGDARAVFRDITDRRRMEQELANVIDVTGVDVIDTSTADRFIRIARSRERWGTECVICAVPPAVSQTLTERSVSF